MSSSSSSRPTFEDAAAVKQLSSHVYEANIHPDYSVATRAHGGNIFAITWKAIALHFETTLASQKQRQPLNLHVEFLRPGKVGHVKIEIKDVRLGRTSSIVHATSSQDNKEIAAVYATFVSPAFTGLTVPMNRTFESNLPPIDFEAVLARKDPNWAALRYSYTPDSPFNFFSQSLHVREKKLQSHPRQSREWHTQPDPDRNYTNEMIAILIDLFIPPPPENFFPNSKSDAAAASARAVKLDASGEIADYRINLSRVYLTLSFSVQIKRALPPEGVKWLLVDSQAQDLVDGRGDIESTVWDADGNIVAVASSAWYVVDRTASKTALPTREVKELNGTKL